MSASCCLWGQTEHDTIKNSLEWSASFLEKYCTDTINLYDVLRCIYNLSVGCATDTATRLNTIATIAKGAIVNTSLINKSIDSDDETARKVRKTARELLEQIQGYSHIPIHGITKYTLQEKLGMSFDDTDGVENIIVHIKGNNRSFVGKSIYECYNDIKNQIDSELNSISSNDKIRILLVFNDYKLVEKLEKEKVFQELREEFSTMTIDILYMHVGVNWFNKESSTAVDDTSACSSCADDKMSVYTPPIAESDITGGLSTAGDTELNIAGNIPTSGNVV